MKEENPHEAFKTPGWHHWYTLIAAVADGGHHGWIIGDMRWLR